MWARNAVVKTGKGKGQKFRRATNYPYPLKLKTERKQGAKIDNNSKNDETEKSLDEIAGYAGDDVKIFLENESAPDNKTQIRTRHHRHLSWGSSRVRWLRRLSASKLEHETKIRLDIPASEITVEQIPKRNTSKTIRLQSNEATPHEVIALKDETTPEGRLL